MTTMPMSVRKFLKNFEGKKRINYNDDASRLMIEVLLKDNGYVSVPITKIYEIQFSPDRNVVYQWCHTNLRTKNWIRIVDRIWFTSDEYRVMFVLQWAGR